MATTFDWTITHVDLLDSHGGNDDVVFRVNWMCTATSDSGKTASQIGVVELDVDNITDFTPASQVTKEQIISWVKDKVAVAVVEKGLMPSTRTINFSTDTSTAATIVDVIAANEAEKEQPPTP